jgi:hypothetical protein
LNVTRPLALMVFVITNYLYIYDASDLWKEIYAGKSGKGKVLET